MKAASGAFQTALFASRQLVLVDLLSITMTNGNMFYFTFYDRDVIYSGVRFTSVVTTGTNGPLGTGIYGNYTSLSDPLFNAAYVIDFSTLAYFIPISAISAQPAWLKRGTIKWDRGTKPNELNFTIQTINASASIGGLALVDAAIAGLLNNATVTVSRGLNPTTNNDGSVTVTEAPQLFFGLITATKTGRTRSEFTVKDPRWLLNQRFPIDIYQPSCAWTLYSPGCGLSKAAYTVTGVVAPGTQTTLKLLMNPITIPNGVPNGDTVAPSGYFDQGIITMTSGKNAGLSRFVQTYLGQGAAASYDQILLNDTPTALYKLNESSGPIIDYSGNGHNATVHGNLTFAQTGATADGIPGVLFDGSTSYITAPIPTPDVKPGGGAVSIEFFMKLLNAGTPDSAGDAQPVGLFDTCPSGGNSARNFSNTKRNGLNNPGIDWFFNNPFMPMSNTVIGTWQHIVIVLRASRTIDLFINGLRVNSVSGGHSGGLSWINPVIGRVVCAAQFGSLKYYNGYMQYFVVFPYALSSDQVALHYTASQTTATVSGGTIVLTKTLPFVPEVGASFTMSPGCDKTQRTCHLKFNNIQNLFAFPYCPVPETAL